MVYNCLNIVGTVLKVPSIIQKADCSRYRMLAMVVRSSILSWPMLQSLIKKSDPSRVLVKSLGIIRNSKDSGSTGRPERRMMKCITRWKIWVYFVRAANSHVLNNLYRWFISFSCPLFQSIDGLYNIDSACFCSMIMVGRRCCPSTNLVVSRPLHHSVTFFTIPVI